MYRKGIMIDVSYVGTLAGKFYIHRLWSIYLFSVNIIKADRYGDPCAVGKEMINRTPQQKADD